MELVQLARIAAVSGLPVAVLLCGLAGVMIVILLVAVFAAPRKEWADRALEVLKVLRRGRRP
jgi:hypothetical protein